MTFLSTSRQQSISNNTLESVGNGYEESPLPEGTRLQSRKRHDVAGLRSELERLCAQKKELDDDIEAIQKTLGYLERNLS